ncbi:MAG TPA: IPT/TIG domain-containing protein [Bdellovibrionota bacterium]|nr:IPT/TIG domain-containing protein [Bdellovibrionota bacterium]
MALFSGCSSAGKTTGIPFQDKVVVTNIDPSAGAGGVVVAINGSGFSEVTHVFFGPNEAAILTVADTSVVVTVPAGTAGAADVTLENDAGDSVIFTGAFTYTATTNCTNGPQVDPLPALAGTNGDAVEIRGKNFVIDLSHSTTVSIGGELADLAFAGRISSTDIIVKVPNLDSKCPAPVCSVDLVVVNPDGCQAVLAGGFSYIRSDTDGDGLSDIEEQSCQSDPLQMDTDGDCPQGADPKLCATNDYYECTYADPNHIDANGKPIHLDARKWDTDGDNLSDYNEIVLWAADPLDPDTDCDMNPDGEEVQPSDPLVTPTSPTVADPAIAYKGNLDTATGGYNCNEIGADVMTLLVSAMNPRALDPPHECKVESIIIRGKSYGTYSHFSVYDNLLTWSGDSWYPGNGVMYDRIIANPHTDLWIPAGVTGLTINGFSGDYPYICRISFLYRRAY